ncbi:MAG: hypothetical protein LUO95_10230 [Methylococcaceae bacterium]|nr:hypothetical protein [Methylococcaceae bacterium]MDD1608630.1 hypothetical protein [Methylococcaceae bacterium]MDD1610942.1 hypothetical protein [Methylococcaceae bacterium]MDD1617165.1 hypothetical protein [Methylococcaceae bacterium]OYV15918.1 MAG: hypothetical protein CG439_2330 [Methylococcaceae bacterium NSP1-2]
MNKKQLLRKSLLGLLGTLFTATVWAHGGAAGTDTDQCKFELEPSHWIHYTAYQPTAYPAEEFCGKLPGTDTKTQLVFDYQDMRYRDMFVEFEVTKEPEGKRVFFLPSAKHKKGSINLELPNGVPEPGKYLIHITLLPDEKMTDNRVQGQRLDVHMGFQAGTGVAASKSSMLLYGFLGLAALYAAYLSSAKFKNKVDAMLGKIKDA